MRNLPENKIKLVFIRHGLTASNMEKRYIGKTDEGLCAEGKKALEILKTKGIYPVPDYLFTGPMKRCAETAKILYPDREAVLIPEWTEIDFGMFEGKNYSQLKDDKLYKEWLDGNGSLPFPNGEGRKEFTARCKKGFLRMLSELYKTESQKKSKSMVVCLIVHGGTIMSLMSRYHKGDYFDYQTENGRGYSCRITCPDGRICFEELAVI